MARWRLSSRHPSRSVVASPSNAPDNQREGSNRSLPLSETRWTRSARESAERSRSHKVVAFLSCAQTWFSLVLSRRGRGGIGGRTGFRFQRRKLWGFESLRPHHQFTSPHPA